MKQYFAIIEELEVKFFMKTSFEYNREKKYLTDRIIAKSKEDSAIDIISKAIDMDTPVVQYEELIRKLRGLSKINELPPTVFRAVKNIVNFINRMDKKAFKGN